MGLVLGANVYMSRSQEKRLANVESQLITAQTDLTIVRARRSDLAALMSDPQTQCTPLITRRPIAGLTGVVAWNESQQIGAVFARQLPAAGADERFILWLIPDTGPAERVAEFDASANAIASCFSPPAHQNPGRLVLCLQRTGASEPGEPLLVES